MLCFFGLTSAANGQINCSGLSLNTVAGPGFKEVTHSFTGIGPPGSRLLYYIYGKPAGNANFDVTPLSRFAYSGEPITFTTNAWGINAFMDTFQTYNFYITSSSCSAPYQSNITTATTLDIQAPALDVVNGPGFETATVRFTGVPGADNPYLLYGKPVGFTGQPLAMSYNASANQQIEAQIHHWGINAPFQTASSYEFYLRVCSGTRCKTSDLETVTTSDIEAPALRISEEPNNQVKLFWEPVDGATNYYVYAFSSANNVWSLIANLQPTTLTYNQSFNPLQVNRYYVAAARGNRQKPSNTVSTAKLEPNLGDAACPMRRGEPVNLSNGNMYINQTDYSLPGLIKSINLTRTYNSASSYSGYFGDGWSSVFDENITLVGSYFVRYTMSDGSIFEFSRTSANAPYTFAAAGVYGNIVLDSANSVYRLTLKDGTVKEFSLTGRLISIADRNGNKITLNYNSQTGILESIKDAFNRTLNVTVANGRITQVSDSINAITYDYYSGTNRLQTVTRADGSKYQFEYHPTYNKLTVVKDALNNILEKHEYDTSGRATTSEKQGGVEKYTFDYTHTNDLTNPYTTVTDALQKVSKVYFDKSRVRNVVTRTEGLCGCGGSGSETTTYEYDTKLNLKKKTEAVGVLNRETSYTYDADGNRLTETDIFGTQKYTYNQYGQVLTYQDRVASQSASPAVYTDENTYDASGNLLTTKDALGYVTTIDYPTTNNRGLPKSVKDARNNTTKFQWNTVGLLGEVEDPYTKKTNYTYDARGRVKTVTNALSHVTTYNYFDDTQRKVEMIYPNSDKITYKFNIRRLLETITDERGKVTTYTFDGAYRLTGIADPLGHTKQYDYNLMSKPIAATDGVNHTKNYSYDDFYRVTEVIYPSEFGDPTVRKETFAYDKLGRLEKSYDMANRMTLYTYDDANRKYKVTNPDNEETVSTYNQRFQTIEVKDAKNQIYYFTYDALGRQLTQTRAGKVMSYVYDEVGNRTKRTDYANRVTEYEYDNLNRLKKTTYVQSVVTGSIPQPSTTDMPLQTSTYTYDDISRLQTATNDAGTVTLNFDSRNRIINTTDVFGQLVEYEYELTPTVNQRRLKLNGAEYARYNYDDANRPANILNSSDNTTVTFGYDEADRLISRALPNGITTNYEYDNLDRIKSIMDTTSSAPVVIRGYNYNSAGQISTFGSSVNPATRALGYDNADRLTSSSDGVANETYSYDDVGNRTSSHRSSLYTYQTGQFNQVTATDSANYAYDDNGNMATKAEGKDLWRFTWDHENRLTTVSTRKQTLRYRYDALGRRTQRYFAGTRENTKFIYGGDDDVLVDDNSGVLTKYLNGDGIDNKLRMQTGTDVKYFLADHLGSTNALADASGNLSATTGYDSFGNATNASFPSRYQFTGREYDNFTGLHHYRARQYDAKLGRFISEDPIGFEGGDVNLYGYVGNDPYSFRDPSGHVPFFVITAGIGAVTSAGGKLLVKMYDNWQCGNGLFDGFLDPGFAKDVVLAGVGGAITGALMGTGLGGSFLGSVAAGGLGSGAQYLIGSKLKGDPITLQGLGQNAALGMASGGIGFGIGGKLIKPGPQPVNPLWITNAGEKTLLAKVWNSNGNRKAAIESAFNSKALLGGLLGGAVSNQDTSPCPCK